MKARCSIYVTAILFVVMCVVTGCNGNNQNSDRDRAIDYARNETQGFELYDGFELYEEGDFSKNYGKNAPQDADGNYIITNSQEAATAIISMPAGFEFDNSSINYVAFSDSVSTNVDFSFAENVTAGEIFETLSDPEFFDSENSYKNVTVSPLKSMNVNGMEVSYFYISYECADGKACKDYKAWTQIDAQTFLVVASASEDDAAALGMTDSIVEQMFRCVRIGSDL